MSNFKASRQMSTGLMVVTLLGLTYSFGTFGFLNLFGIRYLVQGLLVTLAVAILLDIRVACRTANCIPVFVFAIAIGVGGIVHSGYITKPVEALLLIFCIFAIMFSTESKIVVFSKALVFAATFFCSLVALGYIYYLVYPDQLQLANFQIYDSDVGADMVKPYTLGDWLSFTSGDGFVFDEKTQIRLKGYSNEPSSTIVHYLAPAAVAFFHGGRYVYLGAFILLVNVFAIGSLMAYLIILQSIVLFFVFLLPKKYFKLLLTGTGLVFMMIFAVAILQPTLIINLFIHAGTIGVDILGFDLVARKVDGGSDDASAFIRLSGISDGLYLALISPLGYSFEKLGAGAGLLYVVSATSGWVGLYVFMVFIVGFARKALNYCKNVRVYSNQYGVALTVSLVVISVFVSGYGWDRTPGAIMLLLFYRIIGINLSDSRASIGSSNIQSENLGARCDRVVRP